MISLKTTGLDNIVQIVYLSLVEVKEYSRKKFIYYILNKVKKTMNRNWQSFKYIYYTFKTFTNFDYNVKNNTMSIFTAAKKL